MSRIWQNGSSGAVNQGSASFQCRLQSPLRAFSLVELLVAIGIVAVLIGILLPVLANARQKANQIKCMSNLHVIGQLLALYANNNDGYLPWGFFHPTDQTENISDWTTVLIREVHGNLPADYHDILRLGDQKLRNLFVCPEAPRSTIVSALQCDYSCHPRLMPDSGTVDILSGDPHRYLKPYKMAQVQHSSQIALIFDASVKGRGGLWTSSVCAFALDGGRLYKGTFLTDQYAQDTDEPGINGNDSVSLLPFPSGDAVFTNTDADKNYGNIRFRHLDNSQANVLMVDGHVSPFSLSPSLVPDIKRVNVDVNLPSN